MKIILTGLDFGEGTSSFRNLVTPCFSTSDLSCQKLVLMQIEYKVQNGPTTKNQVLPLLLFLKFKLSMRSSFE